MQVLGVDDDYASLQREECQVLISIYPDYVSGEYSSGTVKLEIPVEFDAVRSVEIHDECIGDSSPIPITLSLSALPPLLLELTLTVTYPIHSPPVIEQLHARDDWFPRVDDLRKLMLDMWSPGVGVLYTWVELIRSGEFLKSLEMTFGDAVRIFHPAPQILRPFLSQHDERVKMIRFLNGTYPCCICLTELKGSSCIQLTCNHVFCRSCLEDFWGLCVSEGEIGRLGCPDPACVKEGRPTEEEDIRRILSEEQMIRWRWLKEKAALEKDPQAVHCPMSHCQALVRPLGQTEGGWARLRTCSRCDYSFCAACLRTWHGPISACHNVDKLVLDYLALPEDSVERLEIERRHGLKLIKSIIARFEEDRNNAEWLKANTRNCPKCAVNVERSLGCNHMTCTKCGQHFCYRCGQGLDADSPYSHFSMSGAPCYGRIFDYEADEDENH